MNILALVGHVCYGSKGEATSKGSLVYRNVIAVRRTFKNPNGTYDSDFIKFTAWGATAQYLTNNASKGDLLQLTGEFRVDKVNDREVCYMFATDAKVLVKSAKSTQRKEEQAIPRETVQADDLPF